MKVYIASSYRNEFGVRMLTDLFRARGVEVLSWIENNEREKMIRRQQGCDAKIPTYDRNYDESMSRCFKFDVKSIERCDVFVYYGPSGMDAAAELGAAFGFRRVILGINNNKDDLGLMRQMVHYWFDTPKDLFDYILYDGAKYETL